MTEEQKTAYIKWRQENKDKVNEYNRKWRQENKEKWNKSCWKSRQKKAMERKKQGMLYAFLPKTERELKTIKYLCKKKNINEDEARELLIKYNWNMKQLLDDLS